MKLSPRRDGSTLNQTSIKYGLFFFFGVGGSILIILSLQHRKTIGEKIVEMKERTKQALLSVRPNRDTLVPADAIKLFDKPEVLRDDREKTCTSNTLKANHSISLIIDVDEKTAPFLERTLNAVFVSLENSLHVDVIVVLDSTVSNEYKTKLSKFNILKGFSIIESPEAGRGHAQVFAIDHATGITLVFLQSGIWVSKGWIEELVITVKLDPACIAYPHYNAHFIGDTGDWIHRTMFEKRLSSFSLEWILAMKPQYEHPPTSMVISPAFKGDVFAIKRGYYKYLGGFDPKLIVDGSQYLELSLRAWHCNGAVKMQPCSVVASQDLSSAYPIEKESQVRIARLWKTQPYERPMMSGEESLHRDIIDAADAQRETYDKKLNCKLRYPVYHNTFIQQIELFQNPETYMYAANKGSKSLVMGDRYLAPDGDKITLRTYDMKTCKEAGKLCHFVKHEDRLLHSSGLCLSAPIHHSVSLNRCLLSEPSQQWEFKGDKLVKNIKHNTCLMYVHHPVYGAEFPMLQPCNKDNGSQHWEFKA